MTVTVLCGDAIARLRELPSDSVHCVVTSPPYWGLRDYQTGTWEGGDPECDHVEMACGMSDKNTLGPNGYLPETNSANVGRKKAFRDVCAKCGARRIDQQIGLEPTPEAWAARLVEVFREVKRVLRPDGVCFVNVGDSYAAGGCGPGSGKQLTNVGANMPPKRAPDGLKSKDLVGQPWLLAFALRADGWWLRSEIIWAKPNPMPESVTDRPTKAHEQVFLLTKSARYYYDSEAIRERWADDRNGNSGTKSWAYSEGSGRNGDQGLGKDLPYVGRNARSVWTIATEPFPEAHFATFPQELARRCILASTSAKGCCPECGAPWARVVERPQPPSDLRNRGNGSKMDFHSRQTGGGQRIQDWYDANPSQTTGWRPSCTCFDCGCTDYPCLCAWPAPVPCTVLDPFGGSGTTGLVADQLGRDAVLIELSPEYADMAATRIGRARARRLIGDAPRIEPLPGQLGLF